MSEDVVGLLAICPVEDARLEVALEAARADLLDVDVLLTVLWGVVFCVERDGHGADNLALHPGDALKTENFVRICG